MSRIFVYDDGQAVRSREHLPRNDAFGLEFVSIPETRASATQVLPDFDALGGRGHDLVLVHCSNRGSYADWHGAFVIEASFARRPDVPVVLWVGPEGLPEDADVPEDVIVLTMNETDTLVGLADGKPLADSDEVLVFSPYGERTPVGAAYGAIVSMAFARIAGVTCSFGALSIPARSFGMVVDLSSFGREARPASGMVAQILSPDAPAVPRIVRPWFALGDFTADPLGEIVRAIATVVGEANIPSGLASAIAPAS